MEIKIEISPEEKTAVVNAIKQLTEIRHLTYMSQSMIAEIARMKATKVRATLQELIDTGVITQYITSGDKAVHRFYYTINPVGAQQPQIKN